MRIYNHKIILLLFVTVAFSIQRLAAQNNQQVRVHIDSLNTLFTEAYNTDMNKAEKMATEALELSVQSNYLLGEATAHSNFNVIYIKKENFAKAIQEGFTAIKLFEKEETLKQTFYYGNAFVRLAKAFHMEKDYDRSKAYARQAIAIAEQIKDPQLLALGYEHLGNFYSNTLQVDSTLYYYNKAKAQFLKTNYVAGLANIANNTGAMYADLKKKKEAINYFKEALSIYQKNNINTSYTTGFYNIGLTYFDLNSFKNALAYADSAAYYAEKVKRPTSLLKAYLLKANLYWKTGNLDSSATYYEKAIALKDTIQNDKYKKELAAMQTQSDVYRAETANQLLAKDKRIAVLYRNLALAGFAGLIIILAFLLLTQRIRVQRDVRNKLEEEVVLRTKEIFSQKELIYNANLRLKLALNGAKFDSHFAVKILNTIQGEMFHQSPTEIKENLAKLSYLVQYVLEKSPLEKVPLSEELQMVERYIQLEQLRLNNRFTYTILIKADENIAIPATLVQPFVENAISQGLTLASGDNLHLTIEAETQNDVLFIVITDNGVDRRKEKRNKFYPRGSKVGHERLDLLTHLTHKNHLVSFKDLVAPNGDSAGTKIILQIPLESEPVIHELASIS